MSTIVQIGKRQLTAELICQHMSSSSLLPQLLREIIIDDVLDRWQQANSLQASDTEFIEFYERLAQQPAYQGMNQAQLNTIAIRHFSLQQFKQQGWAHKLGTYYLQRKTALDRVICSIMRHQDGQVAQELYFRLQGGEISFAKLAFKYSQGPEARDGGKIGPISLTSLNPVIAQQAIALQPGELSPLFIHEGSYIFIRLEDRFSAPFDDLLRQFLLDEMFESWLQAQIAAEIGLVDVHQNVIEPEFNLEESSPPDINAASDLQLLTASELAVSLDDRVELSNEGDLSTSQPSNTDLLMSSLDRMLSSAIDEDDSPEPSDTAFLLSPLADSESDDRPLPLQPAPAPAPVEGMFSIERGDTGLLLASLEQVRASVPPSAAPISDSDLFVEGTSDTELLDAIIAAETGSNSIDGDRVSAIATPAIDALIEELEQSIDNGDPAMFVDSDPPIATVPPSLSALIEDPTPDTPAGDDSDLLHLEAIDNGPISSPLQEIVAAQTTSPTIDPPRQPVKKSPFFNLYTVGLLVFVTIGSLSIGSYYYLSQPQSPAQSSSN